MTKTNHHIFISYYYLIVYVINLFHIFNLSKPNALNKTQNKTYHSVPDSVLSDESNKQLVQQCRFL